VPESYNFVQKPISEKAEHKKAKGVGFGLVGFFPPIAIQAAWGRTACAFALEQDFCVFIIIYTHRGVLLPRSTDTHLDAISSSVVCARCVRVLFVFRDASEEEAE
jgi:hypothetical protein